MAGLWRQVDIVDRGKKNRYTWFDLVDVNAMLDMREENEARAHEARQRQQQKR
jgi:hypothetical protein